MKLNHLSILAYASAAVAAPAFSWPGFDFGSGNNFKFPSWPPKTPTPSPVASQLPSKVPTLQSASHPVVPSPSALGPSKPSAIPLTPQKDCTYQLAAQGQIEDGVKNSYCCTDVTVLYARGTTEPGNVGYSTGPSFFKALRNALGTDRVTVQGTAYEATWDGGMVVHNAFKKGGLDASLAQAAVLFGDPNNGQAVGSLPSSKIKQFCATGDSICDAIGGFGIIQAHGTYPNNADEAAAFVVQALAL